MCRCTTIVPNPSREWRGLRSGLECRSSMSRRFLNLLMFFCRGDLKRGRKFVAACLFTERHCSVSYDNQIGGVDDMGYLNVTLILFAQSSPACPFLYTIIPRISFMEFTRQVHKYFQ
ncbi:hypothetical protein KC19_6G062600 [Ceratodon purpureus]|uniref:Uncharacterized protein n=1 Tax=Ceratodon purpureus TaxID=3225 RepID=A0A8T0HG64_CERPU|nr:hypothetical protein KC19_6G062600 [Ceratodon purpureus]